MSHESFQRFALRIHVRRTALLISIKNPTSDNIFSSRHNKWKRNLNEI